MDSRDPVYPSLPVPSQTTDLRATRKREEGETFDAPSPQMECTLSSKSTVTALPDNTPPSVGALYPRCIPSQIQLNRTSDFAINVSICDVVLGRKYYTSTLDNARQYKTRFRSSLVTDD